MATVRYIGGALGGVTEFIHDDNLRPRLEVPVHLGAKDEYWLEGKGRDGIYTYRYVRPDLERQNEELKRELNIVGDQLEQQRRELDEAEQQREVDLEDIEMLTARVLSLRDAVKVLADEL